MPPPRNGRYNAGAQAAQIESIAASVARIETTLITYIREQREHVEQLTTDADKTHAEMRQSITAAEKDIISIQHDTRISSRLQAGLTLLASALAAWVGVTRH